MFNKCSLLIIDIQVIIKAMFYGPKLLDNVNAKNHLEKFTV